MTPAWSRGRTPGMDEGHESGTRWCGCAARFAVIVVMIAIIAALIAMGCVVVVLMWIGLAEAAVRDYGSRVALLILAPITAFGLYGGWLTAALLRRST